LAGGEEEERSGEGGAAAAGRDSEGDRFSKRMPPVGTGVGAAAVLLLTGLVLILVLCEAAAPRLSACTLFSVM